MLLNLKIRISKILPASFKKFLRRLQILKKIPKSPKIIPEKLRNARLYADRLALIEEVFDGGNILEIGVASGKLARFFVKLSNINKYTAVDLDFSSFQLSTDISVERYNGLTTKVLPKIQDDFSLIYLDASHDYISVKKDLKAMRHLLTPGTILIFNDFSIIDRNYGIYGVHAAASEFINDNNVEILGLALEPNGLYDIAVMIL